MSGWECPEVDGSSMRLYVDVPTARRAFLAVIVIQHGPGVGKFIEDRHCRIDLTKPLETGSTPVPVLEVGLLCERLSDSIQLFLVHNLSPDPA